MTLFESGNSSGSVSLEDLCNNSLKPTMTGEVELKKLAEHIVRGGWPGNISTPIEEAMLFNQNGLTIEQNSDIISI